MSAGGEILSGLSDRMRVEHVRGAHMRAPGALSSSAYGWFDIDHKLHRTIEADEQIPCVGQIGDVGVIEPKEPQSALDLFRV